MEKNNNPEDASFDIPFHPFKKGETSRSLQTLLRNENKSFMRFIAMVDNKANIMIHLNSLLLSGIAVFAKFFAPFEIVEKIALFILVTACIISLALAALAARPVRSVKMHASSHHEEEYLFGRSLLNAIKQEDFLLTFDKIIRDQGLIYKNIALEFYTLTKILSMKNKRLRGSYDSLLQGIIITGAIMIVYDTLKIQF